MPKTVLVVDDSKVVRAQVSMVLKRAGFEMEEASDGLQALTMIASSRIIDLVIADVNMPNMDGIEMVTQIMSHPENKNLPILMLSSDGEVNQVIQAKDAGAIGWIAKPFKSAQLIETAKQLTGG